ncbi:glucuronate isomerase [Pseudaestuariivita sp.]|uniref:glucuronate isomerase n=1 Tax=Pseudaestuariivita sp. TaxID=2211669 RepID=UPI0040591D02
MSLLHPDRLFPADPATRRVARQIYAHVKDLPLVCPHGHTDPLWWSENQPFDNPAALFVIPDHYVVRMLVSQGASYQELGIGADAETDARKIWRRFAEGYHLFLGTPSRLWIDHALSEVLGIDTALTPDTADTIFDAIQAQLGTEAFRPRALYQRFGIEVIATTDSALDTLSPHETVAKDWPEGRVVPTYRPDAVVDPEFEGFAQNLETFGALTGCDTATWDGYLDAHRARRAFFIARGATATDHGHPTARTADLTKAEAQSLLERVRTGDASAAEAELFRAQMLTEMARMSCEDGLVMQLHAGSFRNHSGAVFAAYGRDRGFDMPTRTSWVEALHPLLNTVGMDPRLRLILFTLDESTYARELAPLAGAYPCLRLGPPWWFHDSFEGMRRFRQAVTETAGFWNTAGFNDDTRALLSIPARHDVARRCDAAYLADLVTTHRLGEEDATQIAPLLARDLAKEAYRL